MTGIVDLTNIAKGAPTSIIGSSALSVEHPHMPGVKPGVIALLVLVNGAPIVGQVDAVTVDYVTLVQPHSLMMQQGQRGRVQVAMIPFGAETFLPKKMARAFYIAHVLQADVCPADIEKQYRTTRSGLTL